MSKATVRPASPVQPSPPAPIKLTRQVSVMAWIENECGEVLMVRQERGNRAWTLPGGKTRINEELQVALERELREEIGAITRAARLASIYDRARKRILTILFHVQIAPRKELAPQKKGEIAAIAFKSMLPRNSSPSAKYFWKQRRQISRALP